MDVGPVSHQGGGHSRHASSGPEEAALVERAQRGDGGAFDQIVLRHQQEVFAVALRMLGDRHEAQDVAQEAFVRCRIGTVKSRLSRARLRLRALLNGKLA